MEYKNETIKSVQDKTELEDSALEKVSGGLSTATLKCPHCGSDDVTIDATFGGFCCNTCGKSF